MKTIVYSIITLLFFALVATSFTNRIHSKNSILIQCSDKNVTADLLSRSAKIITDRLKDFSSEKFSVSVIPGEKQIQVILSNTQDLKMVEKLVTEKGALGLYETYNRKSLVDLLNGDIHLYSFLNTSNTTDYGAEIGCASFSGAKEAKEYLNSLGLNQKCKFVWNQNPDGSGECLYALKINSEKGSLLVKSDIENVQSSQNNSSKTNVIEITLKESAIHVWADATKQNIGHAIAIVMDNHVLAAPIVRSVISGGKCMISGNFTQDEAKSIASLGNNGELPLNFKIVK